MNKVKKEFLGKQVLGAPESATAGVVNVADEEKKESCTSDDKYAR